MSAPGFVPTFVPPSVGTEPPASTVPTTATDRLIASRALLRAALDERAAADALAQAADAVDPDAPLLERLWQRWQAWRPFGIAGVLAARTANAVVAPIVQRHPVRMTLGAALAGGLLVWSRPWQWTLASALLAGWLPRYFTRSKTPRRNGAWLPLVSAVATAVFRSRDDSADAQNSASASGHNRTGPRTEPRF